MKKEVLVDERRKIKIERHWAMPSMHTFLIPPIKRLVRQYVGDGRGWADPFAGENSPAEITNDMNPEKPTQYHLDALQFLIQLSSQPGKLKGILFDPPYSFTQAKQCYDDFGAELFVEHENVPTMMDYWANCKKYGAQKVALGGIVICCGWNTNGFGRSNGFEMIEILICAHGGGKNDTITTVERKFQDTLF